MAKTGHPGGKIGTAPHTEDLEVLLAVVDHSGLGAAARALGVPKSTVSRRLDRLEATIGVQLIARSRQSVRPTDEGARVAERAREVLRDVDALVASARGAHDTPRGRIRVSAPADLATYSEVWLAFMETYPLVELQLEFTNRYVDVVREGFDLAIRGGRGEDEALITRRLGAYGLRAVAAPAWVQRHGRLHEPKDLRERSCVLLKAFRGGGRPPAGGRHLVLNQTDLVYGACLRGLGVAILPAPLVDADVAAGRLEPVLDAYDPLTVPLYAAYPDRRFLPASTVALLDHVSSAFGS
jgi:DNA-binding transcriptional LysR family regulator